MKYGLLIFLIIFTIQSCHFSDDLNPNKKIFEPVLVSESGIDFSNDLVVNDSVNFFNYGYFYMGGGVSVGDVNQDGLQDIYFTGNKVSNRLYLNKGNFQFEDITEQSGVGHDDRWITGVAMSDVNADGLIDIYLSVAGIWASTKNILYINQGLNADGIPVFADEAESRGVADSALSIQSCFLDYDRDGDIDLYVTNYERTSFGTLIRQYKQKVDNPVWESSDHLYENDGSGNFTDVTEKAGILNFGLSVGVIASDFNHDGWTDVYVSNDFNTPDNFYFNNGDGTFSDELKKTIQHTCFFGMGVDASDFNNDGLLDLIQVDMTPEDNFRSKANMASMDIDGFWENVNAGFHYQYMNNVLQMNQGVRANGLPFFSDVAKLSNMDKTDWSWASLFADFDNDGLNDLFMTNGNRRDINNKDFFKWMKRLDIKMKIKYKDLSFTDVTEKMPYKKVDNYIFKNLDGYRFEKANEEWGIQFEGFSNGAAYADLDNDGDLEIILNNIDSTASVFRNNTVESGNGNYLRISLKGSLKNPLGLNTKVKVTAEGNTQYKEHTLVRGYQSSVGPVIHFGLGTAKVIDEISVEWPDGKINQLEKVEVNQLIEVKHNESIMNEEISKDQTRTIFEEYGSPGLTDFIHEENEFDDFDHQVLLPHRMSRLGPAVAKSDLNEDGLDDLFIGGALGIEPQLLIQNPDGSFIAQSLGKQEAAYEDVCAAFFDADGDGDLDLYVVSGGNDAAPDAGSYQDRLYLNHQMTFVKSNVLPAFLSSGGVVKPLDFDQDGDMDLFIGGRQAPRKYPMPATSYLLKNDTKEGVVQFTISDQSAFMDLGMVTDAEWVDLNGDSTNELVVVGEWMPITIFEQAEDEFVDKTSDYGLGNTVGWWNVIKKADLDHDGDDDMIVGNLGLNYKYKANQEETFDIYASDYDGNGNIDIVLGYYQDDKQFPVRGMQCSSEQVPDVSKKFKNKYDLFANATLSDIYNEEKLKDGIHYKAQNFASVYIENREGEHLKISHLPFQTQTSSLNSLEFLDYDGDGNLDVIAGGNQFNSEIETPRNDACFGWLLKGDGAGSFNYVPYDESGLYVPYDIRHILKMNYQGQIRLLFISNLANPKTYKLIE